MKILIIVFPLVVAILAAVFEKAAEGWYFDPGNNMTHIKIKIQEANNLFSVTVSIGTS